MLKQLSTYIRFALMAGTLTAIVIANSKEQGFRNRLLDYIDDNAVAEEPALIMADPSDDETVADTYDSLAYHPGDWDDYILYPRYRDLENREKRLSLYESSDVNIITYGSLNLELSYGQSFFTKKRYQQIEMDKAESQLIKSGFHPKQELQLHIEGTIGDRMTIYVDHDSRKKDNHYLFKYRALRDDELIRELNAGEIDINFQGSKYAVYDNNTAKGLGVDLTLQKNRFTFRAFGSVTQGTTEMEIFRGNSMPGNIKLSEFQYVRGVYYQIEPLLRYGINLGPPPPPFPANYERRPVNINPSGFELWMDDQDPYNNQNATELPTYGGFYNRLQAGTDYTINFTTGLIRFTRPLADKARVFALYTLLGATTDPYVLAPGDGRHPGGPFAGKNFVFLKYGYSLEDDPVPGQDHTRQDLYEVRSFYSMGDRYILPNNFAISFFLENGIMRDADIRSLGRYSVDYTNGVIEFVYREPFKELLLANGTAGQIYTEHQPANVYDYSRYRIKLDYMKEARSFQLAHLNIIPNSVVVKVDGRKVADNLYTVDYTAGYITFNNSGNPLIGQQTVIEIRYEYLPQEGQQQEFVGGFRGEYEFSRDLKVGGSMIYSRSGGDETIPTEGNEPTQNIFFEGDAALHLDGRRLAQVANIFTREKRKEVPVEINGYAEYAKSYRNVNTFGKALVDNMEASEDAVILSMYERDWVLSSPPSGATNRALLNYYYFRNPASPALLRGIEYSLVAPKVDYAIKAGPFNVATGHVLNSAVSLDSQWSLVFDFSDDPVAGPGDFVSAVTRTLGKEAVDLSGVQYAEISYWYQHASGGAAPSLNVQVGKIDEDADGDGVLDTEDINANGIIDYDPQSGVSEDIGYAFNEAGHSATRIGGGIDLTRLTRGDGVLTSEDLNGNGSLDVVENVYSLPAVPLPTTDQGWKVARIYFDQTTMTQSEINLMKEVEAVRVSIAKAGGVAGRLFVDSIKFVSTKWRETKLDANPASPDNLKVMAINNYEDDEYRWEAFSLVMKEAYKAMYGVKSNQELLTERETALKLEYFIPAGYTHVSATRRFSKPMDFRNYKSLSAWVNVRAYTPGDNVALIIGSSDTDYLVYKMAMGFPRVWQEMKIRLQENSGGIVFPSEMAGLPDLKRIRYLKIAVFSSAPPSTGSLWVDELYLSEPEVQEDSAYWYEGEIKITKPFYRTREGMPVMSDFTVKYVQKGHGAKFSTIGLKPQDIEENVKQVFSSFNILPNWSTKIDYIREDSDTDSLNEEVEEARRGATTKDNVVLVTDYISNMNAVPSVKFMYKYDRYKNRLNERISNYEITRNRMQLNHAPVVHYRQTIDKFLWGRWTSEFLFNMLFKEEEIKRTSYQMGIEDLMAVASVLEIEKRQRTEARYNLEYLHRFFYLRPSIAAGSEEVVTWLGKSAVNNTDISYNINGDYHFPFVYGKNCKFVERNKAYSLSAGLNDFGYVAPGCKVDIQYFENRFRDYNLVNVPLYGFSRAKDARTLVSTNIDLPVYLHKIRLLNFIRTFSFNYNRSLYFTETDVPYEKEQKDPYDEKYGITRTVGRLASAGFNMFSYFPFCFFTGRRNYARGRDYVFSTMNVPVLFADGTTASEYNNNLRLLDNFTASWSADLGKVTITSNAGLHQICERQNIYGIPAQTVTAGFEINLNFDLMKLIRAWIFRPNREGLPYHAAFLTAGYKFDTNMLVTQNIQEDVHAPRIGLSFKRDRASVSIEFGVEVKKKVSEFFISYNPLNRSFRDQIYIDNMPYNLFYRDSDYGYTLSVLFETDVMWIYKFFSLFYRLTAFPIYTLEYSMKINRYDYLVTASPEPYDLHLISSKLTLDLHKNIQGGLSAKVAVEQYRNRKRRWLNMALNNQEYQREIVSFEVGANFTLLF